MPANPKPPKPIRDRAYRELAIVRNCMSCGKDPIERDVVLAHINIAGNFGRGMKAPDDESLFLCSNCHAEMDQYPEQRDRWLVRNILIPQRRAAYRKWRGDYDAEQFNKRQR